MSINNEWAMVREFHEKFRNPIGEKPKQMDSGRARKRYNWMLEELEEFMAAGTEVDQADAMIDLIYFALGTLVEMGIEPEALFRIVHEANMTKLWEDGQPHYNDEGKTIKPAGWQDPYPLLRQAIEKMKC